MVRKNGVYIAYKLDMKKKSCMTVWLPDLFSSIWPSQTINNCFWYSIKRISFGWVGQGAQI